MPVPAQTPNFTNAKWIVFIKDSAFSNLYETYIRNFDVDNKFQKEYSVIWFRQMWKKLNYLAAINHGLSVSLENIENAYNSRRPLYGQIQYETKMFYSRYDGKTYNVLIVDNFDFTIPYTDYYGGIRITLSENISKFVLKESQLRSIIRDTIKRILFTA